MANFNQTNINRDRFFFATKTEGEQDLFSQTQAAGNFTDFYLGITGAGGNLVQINQMPDIIGTSTAGGEEMLYAGTASTYKTLSTLSGTAAGISLSTDRIPGTGVATIESYGTNGSLRGLEILSRGVNSELISTTSLGINNYMSSIGRPGATAVVGASGTFLTAQLQASQVNSIDYPTGGGGRTCFNINDLSGAGGLTAQARWAIGTVTVPTGSDVGSDLAFFSYGDAGNFLTSPMAMKRSDGSLAIANISSIQAVYSATPATVFPTNKTNQEFGAEGKVEVIAGATSNQALFGSPWAPLFSTLITGANPNGQTFLSINFANALSTGSNHVNYKVGFSTATAYTNVVTTSYVPGSGGTWTPSDLPSATSPIGHTLVTCCLDSDGVNTDGAATLYVQGQLSDPAAAADQIFCAKGETTEATRNSLVWHPM